MSDDDKLRPLVLRLAGAILTLKRRGSGTNRQERTLETTMSCGKTANVEAQGQATATAVGCPAGAQCSAADVGET